MIFSKASKTVLITGAAQGIGWATACWLAKNNFDLILLDKKRGTWQKKAKTLAEKEKITIQTFVIDLEKVQQIKKIATKLKNQRIDVLLNNAGVPLAGLLETYQDQAIVKTLVVNLQATILMSKYFLPNLKKSRGLIVNISSGAGLEGKKEFSVYCASKFGVVGFGQSLAKDLKTVKVLTVTPGATNTALFKKAFKQGRQALYQPEETAQIIGETISQQQKYKSGAVVDPFQHLERK
ncbi:SDR family oxidoreductase [Candidatus Nomurabacteria bacterium]|nr:SDR family oxidoreductase [Candidatus Nomurabacteria bacterium]